MNINEYKIVDLFPYKIKDRSKFLFNNHPKDLHPESQKYKDYWKEQYKRCIEGHWVNDDGTWVYMMPKLYFYINVAIISDVKEDNKSARALISPRLRDNEWIIMTYTFCAQGFSGFEKDTEYTCHETIGRLEKGTEIDEVELKALPENTKKPDGTYKKFIPAWDYLTRHYLIDNPAKEPLGLPLYDNPIRNILIFTSRGLGKSLIMFVGVFMHEFLTGGIKKWEQAKDIMKSPLLFFAGSSDERKMNKTLRMIKTFYDNMPGTYSSYNYKNEQVFKPSPFYRKLMGSWKLGESLIHSYKSGDGRDLGSKSMIEFNSIHSHDVATGDRYSMIFVEELGLLKISMQFHDSTKDTLVVNGVKVGMFIGLGTGGDVERVQESKIMFTQPDGYDVYPLANFWENPLNKIGLFIPIQYRDERYKDKQGNTLLEIAHKKEYEDLMKKKEGGSSRSFKTHLMNNPFIPSQIFQTSKYSVFPSDAAINRLTEIETFDLWKKKATVGSLQYSEQARYGVKFVLDEENKLKPITKYLGFDIEKDDTEGALVIYEQPPDIIPTGLYKVVYDPVSKEGVGSSLNSVIVYKGLSIGDNQGMRNNIVAEWIGRLASLRETWERVYMLSRYYNCKIFPETNTPGFVDYIRRTKMQGQILQPSASYVEKELFKNYKHDQSKVGFDVRGNRGQMTFFLDNAINDWLMEDAETDPTTGNTIRRTIDTIYSTRLLEEIAYFDESNFDHISSLRGLMLWLANDRKQSTYKVETEVDTTPKKFESFFTIKKTKNKFLTY